MAKPWDEKFARAVYAPVLSSSPNSFLRPKAVAGLLMADCI